jgi:hypothetical protein
MKYEFKRIDEDTTELRYKDKVFTIKKDVELMNDLQSINVKARRKMILDLSKDGMSTKDLVIETKDKGKTYFDNSNLKEMEQVYIEQETMNLFNELCKKYCNKDIFGLVGDIGLDEDGVTLFIEEFIKVLTIESKTP